MRSGQADATRIYQLSRANFPPPFLTSREPAFVANPSDGSDAPKSSTSVIALLPFMESGFLTTPATLAPHTLKQLFSVHSKTCKPGRYSNDRLAFAFLRACSPMSALPHIHVLFSRTFFLSPRGYLVEKRFFCPSRNFSPRMSSLRAGV